MRIISRYVLIPTLCLLYACANQSSPTGGPKDEEPPELENSIPKHESTNFKGEQIVLEFNEYIKLDKAKEQIIITPTLDSEYEVKYKKNKVILEFDEPLKDNTTYSINFREAVKDITEGNPANELILAFSTGDFLDSLKVGGNVYDLYTNQPKKDITVSLYDSKDTVDVFNGKPIYLTKTDEEGNFKIQNIKAGSYKIYALNDKNKNLMLDSKSESYGFKSDIIELDSNQNNILIPVYSMDVRPLEFQRGRQTGTTFNIKYNKYIDKIILNNTGHDILYNIDNENHNTVQFYNNVNLTDSIQGILTATDSSLAERTDTTYIKFETTDRKPATFTQKHNLKKILSITPVLKAEFTFNKPVKEIVDDTVYLFLDSANIKMFTAEDFTWNMYRDTAHLNYSIDPSLFVQQDKNITASERYNHSNEADTSKAKKKVQIAPYFYVMKGTFISAENDSSTTIKEALSFTTPNQLGTIIVNVKTNEPSYYLQLTNEKGEVVRQVYNGKDFRFDNVTPGDYKLRALIDNNGNQKWDLGNILFNKEPEEIKFYSTSEGNEKLTLRANWELGPNNFEF